MDLQHVWQTTGRLLVLEPGYPILGRHCVVGDEKSSEESIRFRSTTRVVPETSVVGNSSEFYLGNQGFDAPSRISGLENLYLPDRFVISNMHRLPINPELLLALVMTEENAGSLAGDLEERFQRILDAAR